MRDLLELLLLRGTGLATSLHDGHTTHNSRDSEVGLGSQTTAQLDGTSDLHTFGWTCC